MEKIIIELANRDTITESSSAREQQEKRTF